MSSATHAVITPALSILLRLEELLDEERRLLFNVDMMVRRKGAFWSPLVHYVRGSPFGAS